MSTPRPLQQPHHYSVYSQRQGTCLGQPSKSRPGSVYTSLENKNARKLDFPYRSCWASVGPVGKGDQQKGHFLAQVDSAVSVKSSNKNSNSEHRKDIPGASHKLTGPPFAKNAPCLTRIAPNSTVEQLPFLQLFTEEKTKAQAS